MLAAALMQKKVPGNSPLAALANGIQTGMAPDPWSMQGSQESIWSNIGDFLAGRARKGKMDKMAPGDMKSWATPDMADLSSSMSDPYGGGVY